MKLNNRGAASVLVILIIVALATFGGIALTAGWTNKQLSIKAAQSKADYYALDSAAEEVVAEADSLVFEAMEDTAYYLNTLVIESDLSKLSEDKRLQVLFNREADSIKSSALKTKKISELFRRVYYYECAKKLEAFAEGKGLAYSYSGDFETADDFLNPWKPIPESGDIIVKFRVTEGDRPGQKSLDVGFGIIPPEIDVRIKGEDTWKTDFKITLADDAQRYEIYSWKLSQNPIEYEEQNPKFG